MSKQLNTGFGSLEGRTFILGREGHILIDDPAVSKHHAEIKVVNGRSHLRDLGSTNGVYLVENNKAVRFREGYVEPNQTVALGNQRHKVIQLLAIAGNFSK